MHPYVITMQINILIWIWLSIGNGWFSGTMSFARSVCVCVEWKNDAVLEIDIPAF